MSVSDGLRSGFPGPRVAGVACILAPALLLAGTYLMVPGEGGGESYLLSHRPDPARVGAALNFFLAGAVFAGIAGIALARLVAPKMPRLGTAAGLLVVTWAMTAPFFGGAMWADAAIHAAVEPATAEAIGRAAGAFPIPAIVGTYGLLAGWTLLAFAAWRAGVLGAVQAAGLASMCLVPVAIAMLGNALFGLVPMAGMAVGLVPLGLRLLRDAPAGSDAAEAGAAA